MKPKNRVFRTIMVIISLTLTIIASKYLSYKSALSEFRESGNFITLENYTENNNFLSSEGIGIIGWIGVFIACSLLISIWKKSLEEKLRSQGHSKSIDDLYILLNQGIIDKKGFENKLNVISKNVLNEKENLKKKQEMEKLAETFNSLVELKNKGLISNTEFLKKKVLLEFRQTNQLKKSDITEIYNLVKKENGSDFQNEIFQIDIWQQSTDNLIEIITSKNKYRPNVIEQAFSELFSRIDNSGK